MYIVTVAGMLCVKYIKRKDLAASCLFQILFFSLWPLWKRWITPGPQQPAMMSVLPRWWSWKCRGWSLWLPTGLSTAPWRWKEARNSRQTRQRHPSPRKCLSAHTHTFTFVFPSRKATLERIKVFLKRNSFQHHSFYCKLLTSNMPYV